MADGSQSLSVEVAWGAQERRAGRNAGNLKAKRPSMRLVVLLALLRQSHTARMSLDVSP